MSKVLKVIVVGISMLLLTLPAHAQQAAAGQGAQDTAPVEVRQEPAKVEVKQDTAKVEVREDAAKVDVKDPIKQDSAKEQTKGLDEQVQEIKADVLSIATQLNRLEEKLLYPSDTQVAIFVSLTGDEKFRLDAVAVELDGREVAHHLYTFKELEALQKGGVQRIHVGNVKTGEHPLRVTVLGKTEGGSDFRKEESFKVAKGIGPKLVGVVLAGSKTITVKDW